jgi:biotin transport system substrate-specific component
MTVAASSQATLIGRLWPVGRVGTLLRWVVLMYAGTALVALSAQIEVPLAPVPITMQTFAVLVVGMAYGARLGAATLALYLLEGAVGLPVFAGAASGLGAIVGPTGGYLAGFVVAAAVTGALAERGWDRNVVLTALAMLAGNVALYLPGLAWLSRFTGADQALAFGLMPFLLGDGLKLALAACLMPAAWTLVGKFMGGPRG